MMKTRWRRRRRSRKATQRRVAADPSAPHNDCPVFGSAWCHFSPVQAELSALEDEANMPIEEVIRRMKQRAEAEGDDDLDDSDEAEYSEESGEEESGEEGSEEGGSEEEEDSEDEAVCPLSPSTGPEPARRPRLGPVPPRPSMCGLRVACLLRLHALTTPRPHHSPPPLVHTDVCCQEAEDVEPAVAWAERGVGPDAEDTDVCVAPQCGSENTHGRLSLDPGSTPMFEPLCHVFRDSLERP